MPEGGVWLFHADRRYSYSDELILEETLQLPVNGQQINDVSHHRRNGATWITAGQNAIAIDSEGDITLHELKKNEKITAISTTREGEIALLLSTPKAEFRLYTPEFEPIISHPLDEITPSPDNIAETKEGSFWITGKQHILLIDRDDGILISHQHNGDIPQGPGESQLVINNNDQSVWVTTGRTLLHIDTTGMIQQILMEPQRNIELGSDVGFSSAPVLSPGSIIAEQLSYPAELFQSSSFSQNNQVFFFPQVSYYFSFDVKDEDEDIDYSSFTATRSDTTAQVDISSAGYQVIPWDRTFPLTCFRGSLITADNPSTEYSPWLIGGSDDHITCSITRMVFFLSWGWGGEADEELKLNFQVSDREGNLSNTASAILDIDRTPPAFKPELINIDIDNINHTATISGAPGSVESGSMLSFTNPFRNSFGYQVTGFDFLDLIDRIKSTENGSFSAKFQLDPELETNYPRYYGDDVGVFAYDDSFNITPFTTLTLGTKIELSNNLAKPFKNGGIFTGNHSISNESEGYITASYSINDNTTSVPATISGNTYTFTISDIDPSYIENNDYLPVLLEAREENDGYGRDTINLHFDKTPPNKPTIVQPYVSSINGTLLITCNNTHGPCAEPNSTLHIKHIDTKSTSTAQVDADGQFEASIQGNLGDYFMFYAEDAAGNVGDSLATIIGTKYQITFTHPLNNTSYQSFDLDYSSLSISPYPAESGGVIAINGAPASPTTSTTPTYTSQNITANADGTIKAVYSDPYGGYGETTIKVNIDITPPPSPSLDLLSVEAEFGNWGFVIVTGAPGAAEANSTVTITNTATGFTSEPVNVNPDGSFSYSIRGTYGETLSLYATDSAGNMGDATQILAGYVVDTTITSHEDGANTYHRYIDVTGFYDGPENCIATFTHNSNSAILYALKYGIGTLDVDGNNFSGKTYINLGWGGVSDVSVDVLCPNNGRGGSHIRLYWVTKEPNPELITIEYNSGSVTLTGEPNTVYVDSFVRVTNTTTGIEQTYQANIDGSFSITIPAKKGDTLSLITLGDDAIGNSEPTVLELGYKVTLSITSPVDGSEITSQTITVTGTHGGPNTSKITVNDIPALVTGSEYTATNVPIDESGVIQVRLDDSDGAYATASITVTRDVTPPAAPNLNLITTAFSAGSHVYVSGEPDSVEGGATLTITNTSQSESKTLTVADDGSFSAYVPGLPGEGLSLAATDAVGNQGEAATLVLGSEAVITIDSPYEGAIIPALIASNGNLTGLVNVTGHHNGPVNSGIVVNGVVAAVSADQFVAVNVPVAADGIISAKLTALDGSHGTAQLTVGLNEQPYLLSLSPSSTEGMAPHSVSFDWNAYTATLPTEVSIDYDGDGIFDQNSSDLTTPLQHDYTAAGINNVTLRITMADGSFYTTETVVVTHGSDHYDAIFLSLWDGMNGALLASEPMVALNYLAFPAQLEYAKTFQVIAPHMQTIINSYGPVARSEIKEGYLEYIVERNYLDSIQAHYIYSLKGKDGIWRLRTM